MESWRFAAGCRNFRIGAGDSSAYRHRLWNLEAASRLGIPAAASRLGLVAAKRPAIQLDIMGSNDVDHESCGGAASFGRQSRDANHGSNRINYRRESPI